MQINGNEKLLAAPHVNLFLDFIGRIFLTIGMIAFLLGITMFLTDGKFPFGAILFILFCTFFISIGFFLSKPLKKSIKEFERVNNLYNELRKMYPILNSFNETNHINLGVISKQGENQDSILFDIYLEAYKQGADAIVLNSNQAISNVAGGMQATTTGRQHIIQTNQAYNIMATLVKTKES